MYVGKIHFKNLIFLIKILIFKNFQEDVSTRNYLCWRKNGFLILKGFPVLSSNTVENSCQHQLCCNYYFLIN